MRGLVNPIIVKDQKCWTLRKANRLRKKVRNEPDGHPTKKHTKGRMRHFDGKKQVARVVARDAYEDFLVRLYKRVD